MRKLSRISAEGRRSRQNESGVVVIWYSIMLVVTIALIGLAVDAVAFMNLNSSQQEVADAAALAGADKLDGSKDSRTRAETAAKTSLKNYVSWSNDSASVACSDGTSPCPIASVKFFDTLAALKAGTPESSSDKTAAFIKVTTTSRSYIANFIQILGRKSDTSIASAAAVSQYVTCAPLQSFMCNPYEPSTGSTGDGSSFMGSGSVKIGDQFILTAGSGLSPGNWGNLQPPGTSGNSETVMSSYWSAQGTSSCVVSLPGQDARTTAPGNSAAKNSVNGMNVRFDRMTSVSGADLTSAPVVISGYRNNGSTGTSCSRNVSATPTGFNQSNICTDASKSKDVYDYCTGAIATPANYIPTCKAGAGSCPLPRDPVFTNLGTTTGWGNLLKGQGGTAGVLDATNGYLDAYWTNQHTGTRPASLNTRYKIYQAEVNGTAPFKGTTYENATPQCTAGLPAATTAERRLINVGVVDCLYWDLKGRSTLPTLTLSLKMFMTEPATDAGDIYAELVEVNQANQSGGPIKHIVKLVQ